MNVEPLIESLLDWQPPSPSYTPYSTKSNDIIFKSPSLDQHLDLFQHGSTASTTKTSNLISPDTKSGVQMSLTRPSSSTSLKRPRQDNMFSPYYGSPPLNQAVFASGSASRVSNPSLSHSFLEQFDNANIQDSQETFSTNNATNAAAATPQMRTPPPTRDSSSRKRNSQSRLISFTTPSTVTSRRMSAPGEQLPQKGESIPQEASPFQFTPLQFSPIDSVPLSNTGPLTAPAFQHAGLFWDPNSDSDLSRSFSLAIDDPFSSRNPIAENPLFQIPQTPSQFDAGGRNLSKRHSSAIHIDRPQSARPSDLTRIDTTSSLSALSPITSASSVNPSMLWTSQSRDTVSHSNSMQPQNKAASGLRQPYQNQQEQLKREKELDRRRREARSRPPGRASDSLTPGKVRSGLHRSLTDSRVRAASRSSRPPSQSSPIGPQDSSSANRQLHVPRESSPLKRHKSDVYEARPAWNPPHTRKSVVLTVDEMGNARTEVKQFERSRYSLYSDRNSWRDVAVDDSDSSDLPEKPLVLSRAPTPPQSDAKNALREVLQDMRQRRDPGVAAMTNGIGPLLSNIGSASKPIHSHDQAAWDKNSPTTITDPDFMTPTSDRSVQFPSTTRCICNSTINTEGNLMIQCDSCRQWLHVNCLNLKPQRLPQTFVCAFCTANNHPRRVAHLR